MYYRIKNSLSTSSPCITLWACRWSIFAIFELKIPLFACEEAGTIVTSTTAPKKSTALSSPSRPGSSGFWPHSGGMNSPLMSGQQSHCPSFAAGWKPTSSENTTLARVHMLPTRDCMLEYSGWATKSQPGEWDLQDTAKDTRSCQPVNWCCGNQHTGTGREDVPH